MKGISGLNCTYNDVVSKSNDAIFIYHVTGETHELHQKFVSDDSHGCSQDERHKEVDVDKVARTVELSKTD